MNAVEAIAFKTRARTIDHLGREQIADCPTAISELWKNAYDAYASEVALHIFDGEVPVAAILDNGHGINQTEFLEKWLVVGTESKATTSIISVEDRNGLDFREKQGQKGIGRLSSAYLGSLLLLVSKRKSSPFIAALIDWRLFENPFLFLQDITIPIVEFANKEDLWQFIPSMFDKMMSNVWGDGSDRDRDDRIKAAWVSYDAVENTEGRISTRLAIEQTLVGTTFSERHIENWSPWLKGSSHGTAILMAGITYDLEAHLSGQGSTSESDTYQSAKDKLFETLSNFTDPFSATEENGGNSKTGDDFHYSVTAWEGSLSRPVLSDERQFDYNNLEELEHVLEGKVDINGIFRGRVKAFGKWIDEQIVINPAYPAPTRADRSVGPFHIRVGTFEQMQANTTHPQEIYTKLLEQMELYGGFMVFRNGLRVMPYGREDNDFFEIEKRRGEHAGRWFWSYRRIFGRVALTRNDNPNLRDKAGREGIIDNAAAKVFRDIVINILKVSAKRFYGTDSDIRKEELPEINKSYTAKKVEEARTRIKSRRRKEFRNNLAVNLPKIREIELELTQLAEMAQKDELPTTETELMAIRTRLSDLKTERNELSLGQPPTNLGTIESEFKQFKNHNANSADLIDRLSDSISRSLDKVKPKSSRDTAYSEINRNAAYLQQRLRKWSGEAKGILVDEERRISELVDNRNKSYHSETLPLLDDLEHKRIALSNLLNNLEVVRAKQDRENSEMFEPYLSALKSLKESVDIESLVTFTIEESAELRQELDRLNALAQLGITVEIIGHEIEGLEMTISHAMDQLPETTKVSSAFKTIRTAHQALVDRLRFLSPLKLSGEKIKSWISGEQISEYLEGFMGNSLERRDINFKVSEEFVRFSVFEQPSRIYPVFINLINNASYWVSQGPRKSKNIIIDIVDKKVVISDDGPGVEEEDLKSLFTLFFTRKIRSGRGVGLYLCRANLAAGGHSIRYATEKQFRRLPGANFIIDFSGAKNG